MAWRVAEGTHHGEKRWGGRKGPATAIQPPALKYVQAGSVMLAGIQRQSAPRRLSVGRPAATTMIHDDGRGRRAYAWQEVGQGTREKREGEKEPEGKGNGPATRWIQTARRTPARLAETGGDDEEICVRCIVPPRPRQMWHGGGGAHNASDEAHRGRWGAELNHNGCGRDMWAGIIAPMGVPLKGSVSIKRACWNNPCMAGSTAPMRFPWGGLRPLPQSLRAGIIIMPACVHSHGCRHEGVAQLTGGRRAGEPPRTLR